MVSSVALDQSHQSGSSSDARAQLIRRDLCRRCGPRHAAGARRLNSRRSTSSTSLSSEAWSRIRERAAGALGQAVMRDELVRIGRDRHLHCAVDRGGGARP